MIILYAVSVRVVTETSSGRTTRDVPVFYLHPEDHGITDEAGAARVAKHMFNPNLDPDILVLVTVAAIEFTASRRKL